MNCRPGDLAVVIRSAAGNAGLLVTCIRLASSVELDAARYENKEGPVWVVDRELMCSHGTPVRLASDCRLRPIRYPGEDAQDETLSWLPAPSRDEVTA